MLIIIIKQPITLERIPMKLHQLATAATTSVLLLSTLAASLIKADITFANESLSDRNSSVQLVAKNVLRSGSFVTTEQDHPTTGKASIVNERGQRYLEFDAAFGTASGPDVQVILHRNKPVPVNLSKADYITLAPLKSTEGTQRYAIPDNIQINNFESVAIWCRKFNVTFGYAGF